MEIIHLLHHEGARVQVYDPAALDKAREFLPEVKLGHDAYEAAAGCDALVVVTEWNEFKQLDLQRLRSLMAFPFLLDGRNIYDPQAITRLGFVYSGFGRQQAIHYPPSSVGTPSVQRLDNRQ